MATPPRSTPTDSRPSGVSMLPVSRASPSVVTAALDPVQDRREPLGVLAPGERVEDLLGLGFGEVFGAGQLLAPGDHRGHGEADVPVVVAEPLEVLDDEADPPGTCRLFGAVLTWQGWLRRLRRGTARGSPGRCRTGGAGRTVRSSRRGRARRAGGGRAAP